jgi:hypothetical protein
MALKMLCYTEPLKGFYFFTSILPRWDNPLLWAYYESKAIDREFNQMPSYTRGVGRDQLTFVKTGTGQLYYGFTTKDFASLAGVSLSVADLTRLGHLLSTGIPAGGLKIFGAKSPKPPRVTKVVNKTATASQQRTVSTFCGVDNVDEAEADGWRLTNSGRPITVTNNSRTKTVAASLTGGGLYLWPMNADDVTTYAAELGLQSPEQLSSIERAKSFVGATRPRPPKVKRDLDKGGDFSSFCSHDKLDNLLAAGWQLIKPEIIYGGSLAAT